MWTLFWDTWGTIADNLSRTLKIVLFGLLLLAIFFFFGLNAVFYFVGAIFTIGCLFLIIANVVIRMRRAREKSQQAAPIEMSEADQADIAEFQEAMNRQPSAQTATKKAPPPENLPGA